MSSGSYHASTALGSLEPGTHLCGFHRDEPDHVGAQDALASVQLVVSSFAEAYGTRRPAAIRRILDISGLHHERLRLEP